MRIAELPVSVRRDIARHPDTPARALAALVAADGPDIDPDLGASWKVARHHNTPARALVRLSKCLGRRAVLCAVAVHPNTPATALDQLAKGPDPEVAMAVASNPKAPPGTLEFLALLVPEAQRLVARNPRAPAPVLARLAYVNDDWVRACVARHPRTPVRVLYDLAEDPHPDVRWAVADHPKCPDRLLRELIARRTEA